MVARAYWKGHIRLSLVAFPVQLYPAIEAGKDVRFHYVHRPTGERVHYQPVVEDRGPVERDEISKGYEYERDKYVIVEKDELEKLKLESTHTIELVQFVGHDEIDAIYYDRPYFVVPDGKLAEEAYRVLRDALRETGKTAVGQVVLSNKERIVAIRPCGRGLLMETLRYENEVREAERCFEDVGAEPIRGEQLELAEQLIKSKSAKFDPGKFKDHYQAALRELVAAKLQGRLAEKETGKPAGGAKVINLMDALKRSLKTESQHKPSRAPKARSAPRRAHTAPRTRRRKSA
jgi:DNA end-binding protein Ku